MFNWYPTIKQYYEMGFYTNENVKVFVEAKWITEEQYKEITGVSYNEESTEEETSDTSATS